MVQSLFELEATDAGGRAIGLSEFRDKVVLVVNTASKCGFTYQYKGLEELYQRYSASGFVVIGFPCDQFGHQEPAENAEIVQFCQTNFGVSFPLMAKIEVNGPGTHPVFEFLKARGPGRIGSRIKWNFTKFLVGRDGKSVKRFAPMVEPATISGEVEAALERKG